MEFFKIWTILQWSLLSFSSQLIIILSHYTEQASSEWTGFLFAPLEELLQLAGLPSVLGAGQSCSSYIGQSCTLGNLGLHTLNNLASWANIHRGKNFQLQSFYDDDTKLPLTKFWRWRYIASSLRKVWENHPSIAAVLLLTKNLCFAYAQNEDYVPCMHMRSCPRMHIPSKNNFLYTFTIQYQLPGFESSTLSMTRLLWD